MRSWASALALVAVAGCSATAPSQVPPAPTGATGATGALCEAFVEAWVGHFKANVAKLDGQRSASLDQALAQTRQALRDAGQDENACQRPYCVVQPKAGGRLDSYCGYRLDDPSGKELYRWLPWASARR